MNSSQEYDVAIIGGGHNGLTAAAYLARANLKTVVLEKNTQVGGAALTEEFHPGFRNSLAAYTVSLLNPVVIKDLELTRHGLTIVERPVANFWPIDKDRSLLMPYGTAARQIAIAKFSQRDASRLPEYDAALERAASILRAMVLEVPPNAGGGIIEMLRAARVGGRIARLPMEDQRIVVDLFTKSASDFLDGWFESETVKGAFAFDGIVGAYASPTRPGTAYVLLHHCFGEVNGKTGVWGHAIGGMGAISESMAKSAKEAGAQIETNAVVDEVLLDGKKVGGVKLADGREIRAKAVAANVPPKLLFRDLIPSGIVNEELARRFKSIKSGSGTFRMNVALSELPEFSCSPGKNQQDHHGAGIIFGPTVEYLENAYLDARAHGWSTNPVIEMLIPSTIDDSLAPPGKHVASLFVQHVAPQLPKGRSWTDESEKQKFANIVIQTITTYAPNFASSILSSQILSPLDLEKRIGLIDGDIFHGQLSLDQLFSARPVLGHADYRMPIEGLYLCGAGAHPGGGVTGVPGRNAARTMIKDFKRRSFSL